MHGQDDQPGPPTLAVADGIARLRLNRPAHHNRLEPADIDALDDAIQAVERDAGVQVLLLGAAGPSFCAGYDLSALAAGPSAEGRPDQGIGRFAAMLDRLEHCRVPTICALNGPVYGGGTDLALTCDLRVGTQAARMFMPAVRFGLHYYGGGLRRYTTRLLPGAAKRLFLLGEPVDAAEMLRIGYLSELVPDAAALGARTEAMCRIMLAAAAPPIVQSTKALLTRMEAGDLDPTEADRRWAATRSSTEVAAAVRAARRKP